MSSVQAPSRHKVVVIGSGFGGLFGTKALKRAPVDVTMVAKTTHHLFQPLLYQVATGILSEGEIAPPDPRGAQQPGQRARAARRGHRHRPRRTHGHQPRPRPRDDHALRLADRGRRRGAVLLRQRPLRRARARHEEHRRRPRAARAHLRRLRDGRARRQPRRQRRPPADLRGRGRRSDRRGDGRPDRRARAPHPQARLPGHQHAHRARDPARRRPAGAAAVRPEARGEGRRASWRSSASR